MEITMALTSKPTITKVDPRMMVTPLLKQPQKKATIQQLPTLAGFVQKNTGVSTGFTPESKTLQTGAAALKGETQRIKKAVETSKPVSKPVEKKQAQVKPEFTRDDIVWSALESQPDIKNMYDAGELNDDDIYAIALQKNKKVRDLHDKGQIDNTARVQQESQDRGPAPTSTTLGDKVLAGIAGIPQGVAEVGQNIEKGISKVIGVKPATDLYKGQEEALFGKAKEISPHWFEGGKSVGKTAATMALTPGGGNIKKLGVLGNIGVGAVQGAIGAETNSLLSEGKNASWRDIGLGAAYGGVFGGGSAIMSNLGREKALLTKLGQGSKISTSDLGSKGNSILSIIKENPNAANLRKGLKPGDVQSSSRLSRAWSGTKGKLNPSKKSMEASAEIVSTIKNPSSKPEVLFNQVDTAISNISKDLSTKLKSMPVAYRTKFKSDAATIFREVIDKSKEELGGAWNKEAIKTFDNFKKSETLDDVWKAAKEFDAMIPDKIKSGENLSGREELVYKAWRKYREAFNTFLEEEAAKNSDVAVKEAFKKMSRLFHARNQISDNIPTLMKQTSTGIKGKLAKAGKYAGGAALGYMGFQSLKGAMGGGGGGSSVPNE